MRLPHGGVISAQQHPTHEVQTAFLLVGTLAAAPLSGADIGTNAPALPLTHERIATLPTARQPAWRKYLGRSERQMQADRAFLKREMRNKGPEKAAAPLEVRGVKGIALDRHAAVAWSTRRPPHCQHHRLVPDTVGRVEENESTRLYAPLDFSGDLCLVCFWQISHADVKTKGFVA